MTTTWNSKKQPIDFTASKPSNSSLRHARQFCFFFFYSRLPRCQFRCRYAAANRLKLRELTLNEKKIYRKSEWRMRRRSRRRKGAATIEIPLNNSMALITVCVMFFRLFFLIANKPNIVENVEPATAKMAKANNKKENGIRMRSEENASEIRNHFDYKENDAMYFDGTTASWFNMNETKNWKRVGHREEEGKVGFLCCRLFQKKKEKHLKQRWR